MENNNSGLIENIQKGGDNISPPIMLAPSRSGKGVSSVIPFINNWKKLNTYNNMNEDKYNQKAVFNILTPEEAVESICNKIKYK